MQATRKSLSESTVGRVMVSHKIFDTFIKALPDRMLPFPHLYYLVYDTGMVKMGQRSGAF